MWPFSKKRAAPPAPPPKGPSVHEPVLRALGPWIERTRRRAFRPRVEHAVDARRASHFGGAPSLRPGEAAPACAGCGRAIDLLLQLDGRETPAGSTWSGPTLLQVFYCRRCEQDHEGWAPFSKAHLVRSIPAAETGPGAPLAGPPPFAPAAIVGWDAFDDAPASTEQDDLGLALTYDVAARRVTVACPELGVRIADLDADAADAEGNQIAEALSQAAPGDKLGGWPFWIQGVEYPSCPRCARRMHLVFQLDSEDNVDIMFGDSGCAHVTQCPEHPDVLALAWACA
jgi:hypothetical protein